MAGDEKKVAWILGAGFSRPLGGPLLDNLISRQMVGDFRNWSDFHEEKNPEGYDKIDCAEAVHGIYTLGCQQTHSTYWSNAEQFIERLDWACRDSTNLWALRIRNLLPHVLPSLQRLDPMQALNPAPGLPSLTDLAGIFVDDVKLLRREAIRFVAGACSYFTRNPGNISQLELWHPYLHWGNKLGPQDIILPFNYDNVLDLLDPHLSQAKFRWVMPKNSKGDLVEFGYSKGTKVYHLHGHVGWERQPDGSVIRMDPMAFLDPDQAVLGMPGPSKKDLSESQLAQVWNVAFHELASVDVLVFVGYRFPESDGLARFRILEALRNNPKAKVYIVLGPRNNADIARVREMINWTRISAPDAQVERMWAEDFFHAFDRKLL